MKAKKEIRQERDDIVSFWVDKKVLNENDEIAIVEEKVEECTLIELQNRIVRYEKDIAEIQVKILEVNLKIDLVNTLTEDSELVEVKGFVDFKPEKRFEIKSDKDKFLKMVEEHPEFAMYRKQAKIDIFYYESKVLFYVDNFLEGHKELLEQYLGADSITDRQNEISNV